MLDTKVVDETPWMYEEEAWCPTCGTPHQLVRPGKTQPNCVCHLICETCGGRIVNHSFGEDKNYPNVAGDWCPRCGPFGADYNG